MALDTARWTFQRNEWGKVRGVEVTNAHDSMAVCRVPNQRSLRPLQQVRWAAQHGDKNTNLDGGALSVSGKPRRDAAAGLQQA